MKGERGSQAGRMLGLPRWKRHPKGGELLAVSFTSVGILGWKEASK